MLVTSGVAAFGIERRSKTIWAVALSGSAFGSVVFISRLRFYFQHYDVVANAGWKTFLWANSLFAALAIAGVLCAWTVRKHFSNQSRRVQHAPTA